MQNNIQYLHSGLSEIILGCCFDVMNELGVGFLESVYKRALYVALQEKGLKIEVEKRFEVMFRESMLQISLLQIQLLSSLNAATR